ncbi:MAG: phospholipase D-like domain-containing protein [Deltaproteobacteria bacterium]|jgi:cardiolipin synthase
MLEGSTGEQNQKSGMRRSWISIICQLLFCFISVLCLVAIGGCSSSLPHVEDVVLNASESNTFPEIIGPQGPFPYREGKEVIERLEQKAWWSDILQRQIAMAELIGGLPLTDGNKVALLDDQAVYGAMLEAIKNARDTINLETYAFEDDEVGREFASLLLEKQAEGVQVNLIYDSAGCFDTPDSFFRHLRDGGVNTLEFNPLDPFQEPGSEWEPTERDHRKILVVDGSIAITGSANIGSHDSESLYGDYAEGMKQKLWREIDVRIEGPAVAELQRLFLDTWARQKGPELSGRSHFPSLKKAGDHLVRVVGSTPGKRNRDTYLMYAGAITFAENSVHITAAYFVPDKEVVKALTGAAERGVDVKLILPSSSDHSLVFSAGRSYYTQLLKSGVKVFERRKRLLHAKTAVIDGVWSTVGSTNMDLWSFLRDNEVNAVILGRGFGGQMEEMFARDLEKSHPITLEQWEKRPLTDHIAEWFGRMFGYWF